MFFAVGTMTQTIIELELQERFGKRRTKRMINHLHDHFIVCGYGRVGRSAALELQKAKAPFVMVDRNEQRVERAAAAGALTLLADATRDETLRQAGVLRAKGLIAALASDADNLFVILSAKTLNPKLTVVTRAAEEEAEEKLRRAGADIVFAPYSMTGQRLAQALTKPHVSAFLNYASGEVGAQVTLEQVRVQPGSEADSTTIGQIQQRRELGVIVLAIRRSSGQMLFNPPPETRVSSGDFLIVAGEKSNLQQLEEALGAT